MLGGATCCSHFCSGFPAEETVVPVPLAADQDLVLELPTIAFISPVSIREVAALQPDADDPDVDIEESLEDDTLEVEGAEDAE
jgi:hypothetical protein